MRWFVVGIMVAALVIPAASASAVRIDRSAYGSSGASLNGHEVILDGSGKIRPWAGSGGYSRIVRRAWSFLLNDMPVDANGLKLYYSYPHVDPDNLAPGRLAA